MASAILHPALAFAAGNSPPWPLHPKRVKVHDRSFLSSSRASMPANLYAKLQDHADEEQFLELLSRPGLRIERIVSTGQCSPPGFWYDQPHGEWVALLAGEARLRFADEAEARTLKAGDYLDIPPHRRHRLEWTPADATTIWLAVHYGLPGEH